MKINEKNIAGFAVSNSPIDKEGWLLKRGEVNKTFQRRWFVLKGNLLFYFEKKTEKEPAGVIILEGCTIELAEYEEQYAFKIVFHGAGDRTYVLGADTQETMESWMKSLARASYDYMKLMVSELQRKLDEIIELEKAHSTSIFGDQPLPPTPPRQAGLHKAASVGRVDSNRIESGSGFPMVPPRRKGGSQVRRDPKLVPGQRINPFNRCQSEEDVEKCSVPAVMSNSAPGTPRCHRHNGDTARPSGDAPRNQEKLQGRPRQRTANQTFAEVHSTYGERIMCDVLDWQGKLDGMHQQRQVPEAQLIKFD